MDLTTTKGEYAAIIVVHVYPLAAKTIQKQGFLIVIVDNVAVLKASIIVPRAIDLPDLQMLQSPFEAGLSAAFAGYAATAGNKWPG